MIFLVIEVAGANSLKRQKYLCSVYQRKGCLSPIQCFIRQVPVASPCAIYVLRLYDYILLISFAQRKTHVKEKTWFHMGDVDGKAGWSFPFFTVLVYYYALLPLTNMIVTYPIPLLIHQTNEKIIVTKKEKEKKKWVGKGLCNPKDFTKSIESASLKEPYRVKGWRKERQKAPVLL